MGMERAMIPPGALYNNYISRQTLNLIEPPFSKKGGRGALDQKPRQQGIKPSRFSDQSPHAGARRGLASFSGLYVGLLHTPKCKIHDPWRARSLESIENWMLRRRLTLNRNPKPRTNPKSTVPKSPNGPSRHSFRRHPLNAKINVN